MSNDQQHLTYQDPPKSSGLSCFVIGCITLVILSILVCGGGGIFLYFKWKDIAVNVVGEAAKKVVQESEMSSKDKKVVSAQIDRVVKAIENDEISVEEAGELIESIVESPLFPLAAVYFCEKNYIEQSGLSPEEKEAAHTTMQRIARGVYEKKIDNDDLKKAMEYITETTQGDDNSTHQEFKDPKDVSDEDIRSFLAELEKVANENSLSEEEFTVDIGEEVKHIVDEALR